MHDFITTSSESLSSALLHFDLNEIKDKLDKIISQQQEIIIQQYVMYAQNQQILQQNQKHLQVLANIETNTANAALYSEIAANNAEICAWLSAATFLENKKQNRMIASNL